MLLSPQIFNFAANRQDFPLLFYMSQEKKAVLFAQTAWEMSIRKHHSRQVTINIFNMKKYIKPITEIEEQVFLEECILAGSTYGASDHDMQRFEGVPVMGSAVSDPIFNSNNFTSEGAWE